MQLFFCRTSKSYEVTKPEFTTPKPAQTVNVSKAKRPCDPDLSDDDVVEISVGELVIGVFAFTFLIVLTLMQCLVVVSGDLFEEPTKTIVNRVIQILLISFMAIFAISAVALVIMACTELVFTCKRLCENEKDIEQGLDE